MKYPDIIMIEIFWRDLTEEAQIEIAEQLGMNVDDVESETNWDVFPIATTEISV